MFVSSNKFEAVKTYFYKELEAQFSKTELKFMFSLIIKRLFQVNDSQLLLNDVPNFSESDLLQLRSYVKRLQKNEPFQYIYGSTEFYGLTIKVDKNVLIPRPETEELIYLIAKEKETNKFNRIIDVCSGSGCISLALKSAFPKAEVFGLEIDSQAIALSKENAELNKFEINFLQHDFLGEFPEFNHKFDLIVSNPPYIAQKEAQTMQENVLAFEPHLALFVEDDDTLLFYKQLALFCKDFLSDEGVFYAEINENLSNETLAVFLNEGFKACEILKDLQNKKRYIKVSK